MTDLPNGSEGSYFDHMVNARDMAERIYGFMRERAAATGIVPSTREIAAHLGLKSHGTVLYHLATLQRDGRLWRQGRRWGLRELSGLLDIPLYGSIPAGFAEEAVQEEELMVRMDLTALGIRPKGPTYLLRVRGDSMEGARIFDGESTLKTYVVRRGVPYLRPENPKYPDLIPARDLEIQGVLLLALRAP